MSRQRVYQKAIKINMSDELYKWVGKEAKRLGVSKNALIRNLLRLEMEIQEEK